MTLTYERLVIRGDNISPDLLIWRRYKRKTTGILELFLRLNPHVHAALAKGPFLPVGVLVLIPIDSAALSDAPKLIPVERLWGTTSDVN